MKPANTARRQTGPIPSGERLRGFTEILGHPLLNLTDASEYWTSVHAE